MNRILVAAVPFLAAGLARRRSRIGGGKEGQCEQIRAELASGKNRPTSRRS